jgi:hypothetical protein
MRCDRIKTVESKISKQKRQLEPRKTLLLLATVFTNEQRGLSSTGVRMTTD